MPDPAMADAWPTPLYNGINGSTNGGANALLRGGGTMPTDALQFWRKIPFSMTCGLTYDPNNSNKGRVTMIDAGNLYDNWSSLIVSPVVSSEWAATASPCATATIGAASATVLTGNTARTACRISNTHATQTLYLSLDGNAAEIGKGVYIGPGQSWEMSTPGTLSLGTIKGISSGAGTVVAVQEWT